MHDDVFILYVQNDAYSNWLHETLIKAQKELGEDLIQAIDGVAEDFGCHSAKKLAETRLTTMPGGPPVTSALMRCGQTLNVQGKYVRDDVYGNEICSRVAAGFDTDDTKFGALPARFNPNVYPPGSIDYRALVPGYDDYVASAPSFVACIPYYVAAVVHHHDWLEQNLAREGLARHDFFDSLYYTQGFASLNTENSLRKPNGILLGEDVCEITNMRSTGVPLWIRQQKRVEVLTDQAEVLADRVESLRCQQESMLKSMQETQERLVSNVSELR